MFIQTEKTPNVKSLKFTITSDGVENVILPEEYGTGMYFERHDKKEIARSPLAQHLFKVSFVKSVFFGRNFITVTKDMDTYWRDAKELIFAAIMNFYMEHKPVIEETPNQSDTAILDTDSEVVATIKELIETRVRPSVQEDGGDIFFEGFEEATGVVKVRLAGSCVGCPSSSITLRNGVENMLMHYIPEVKGIEDVTGLPSDKDGSGETTASGDMKLSFAPETVGQ
eukprot:CAMPEP_0170389944 /NCGR_PEP_ID=MMETSP0117_2-20130122/18882_1 /TAXON_ID=400756 /ORGANISM="Durinskia baltica, Strain CSIRO CS-38" /LENGTH=225 /DNA_ID=CAMNT_0010645955 /DNA_START=121 /DNA_END=798 /DNA_ORIENTATION=+